MFCPSCGLPVVVLDVLPMSGAGGDVELTRWRCFGGHTWDTWQPTT